MLIQRIDEERVVLQHKAGGFRIDIAVKSKVTGREFIAIECDGATYHGSAEAYAWDAYRQNILEEHGFVFHRIWSREYWENPKREIEKLVHFIHEQDKIDREYQIPENPSTADIFLDDLLSETDITYSSEDTDDKDTAPKEKSVKETSEEESRQIDIKYEIKVRPKVEIGQVIKLKELENNKEFKVKLASDRSKVKVSKGVTILDKKSPIGEAILGRQVGDTVELNNLEKYYKIISVES